MKNIKKMGVSRFLLSRQAWIKRLKYDDNRAYAQKTGVLKLRVIKNTYEYRLTDSKHNKNSTV